MKKLLLIAALCAITFVANAQVRTFHFKDGTGYWVKVDLTKKTFLADGCGVDPETIKNYKKSGNKESFITSDGGRNTHHEFVKKSETDYTYTYWYTPSETIDKAVVEVTTKGGSSGGEGGVKGKATEKVASKNPLNKVGSGVKGLFNKGKGFFKKDKGDAGKSNTAKVKKETKAQPADDIMYAPEK